MPVQAVDFDVLGRKFSAAVADGHNSQINHADHNVRHVQPGDAEKHRAEKRRAFGISGDGEAPSSKSCETTRVKCRPVNSSPPTMVAIIHMTVFLRSLRCAAITAITIVSELASSTTVIVVEKMMAG